MNQRYKHDWRYDNTITDEIDPTTGTRKQPRINKGHTHRGLSGMRYISQVFMQYTNILVTDYTPVLPRLPPVELNEVKKGRNERGSGREGGRREGVRERGRRERVREGGRRGGVGERGGRRGGMGERGGKRGGVGERGGRRGVGERGEGEGEWERGEEGEGGWERGGRVKVDQYSRHYKCVWEHNKYPLSSRKQSHTCTPRPGHMYVCTEHDTHNKRELYGILVVRNASFVQTLPMM